MAALALLPVLTTNQKGAIAEARVDEGRARGALRRLPPALRGRPLRPHLRHGRHVCSASSASGRRSRVTSSFIRSYTTRRNAEGHLAQALRPRRLRRAWCVLRRDRSLLPHPLRRDRRSDAAASPARRRRRTTSSAACGWQASYEFGATLPQTSLGPIAQLGERRHGMAEVVGSIPTGSINRGRG